MVDLSRTALRVAAVCAGLSAVTTALLWLLPRLYAGRSPSLAGSGYVWFVMWGFTELLGVTTSIFAVNGAWRAQFARSAPDAQDRLRTLILGFEGAWDALFFVVLVASLLGSLFYGLAAWLGQGLERWIGALFLLAVPLTLGIIIGSYTKIVLFDGVVAWVYPVLQPVSRALLGYWLWLQGRLAGSAPP